MGVQGSGTGELLNVFHTRDLQLARIATLFESELDMPEHPAQAMLIDSAANMLIAHLLRSYDAFGAKIDNSKHGLGPRTLTLVLNYIEDHISRPIRLEELAGLAGVSRFHFSRLFKRSTGVTPMTLIEQSRMNRARELIRAGGLSLSDIALSLGFADQSHFTRRFHRHVHCTPAEFAHLHSARKLPGRRAHSGSRS